MTANSATGTEGRWVLYRLVSDPVRLRLLGLASEEELSIGELSELVGESQPNVSRHTAALRQGGLLSERRHGTRSFLRLAEATLGDVVVADAVAEGRRLCDEEGRLQAVAPLVSKREARSQALFESSEEGACGAELSSVQLSPEIPAFVYAISRLSVGRSVAVDVGTGGGALLDVLAPAFKRVVAIDRSRTRLAAAEQRTSARGYDNVLLLRGSVDEPQVRQAVGDGADAVFAVRVLHHAAVPRVAMASLTALLRPGGQLVLLDYEAYDDPKFQEARADVWMGFSRPEVLRLIRDAGLVDAEVVSIPSGYLRGGVDACRECFVLVASRPLGDLRGTHVTTQGAGHDR